jgi:ribosomal protein S18 acetylase RimI-like enzyme
MMFRKATLSDLEAIALCHLAGFPHNLSSKLGKKFVMDMLKPFATDANKFLILAERDGHCMGYVNGLVHDGTIGSASSMLLGGFNQGILALLRRPWLIFHPEVRSKYPLVWRNVKRKIFRTTQKEINKPKAVEKYMGIPGMCVDPAYRGQGLGKKLMLEGERVALEMGYTKLRGTVSATNEIAWKNHLSIGWKIVEHRGDIYKMEKELDKL